MKQKFSEKATFGTSGKLIAPGIVVPGTISITSYELYFDADEEDILYKEQDPKVLFFYSFTSFLKIISTSMDPYLLH